MRSIKLTSRKTQRIEGQTRSFILKGILPILTYQKRKSREPWERMLPVSNRFVQESAALSHSVMHQWSYFQSLYQVYILSTSTCRNPEHDICCVYFKILENLEQSITILNVVSAYLYRQVLLIYKYVFPIIVFCPTRQFFTHSETSWGILL